ncbi:hypothetical protein EV715DRAFT_287468 [Schizophyllum commune]
MDYTPRHNQPFTLEQAVHLDVAIITEEISRLQNSLQHLKETQDLLRSHLKSEADPDLQQALNENEEVIGSQTERINILRMALTQKGILGTSSHYDTFPPTGPAQSQTQTRESAPSPSQPPATTTAPAPANGVNGASEASDEDGGLHL